MDLHGSKSFGFYQRRSMRSVAGLVWAGEGILRLRSGQAPPLREQ